MEEFRLHIDLYGDKGNSGLLVIRPNQNEMFVKVQTESSFMEDVTPEKVGEFVSEYLKKYYISK